MCNEYIEDPKKVLARNNDGQILRAKMKITMSYSPGVNPVSPHFKGVQLNIELPPQSTYMDQKVYRYEQISFEGNTTPTIIHTFIYPTNKVPPNLDQVNLSLTYQQMKDPIKQTGTLRSAAISAKLGFPFFTQILPDIVRENDSAKVMISLDKQAPSLLSVFRDVIESQHLTNRLQNTRMLTFLLHNHAPVSILVSKDDVRIRFQSTDFASLNVIVTETVRRI